MRKSRLKGFTMIELIIVILIIGILSTLAVPMYRGYTRRAMASEGKALLEAIAHAEKLYRAESNQYLSIIPAVSYSADLNVDARRNKYYRTFEVAASGVIGNPATMAFVATVYGSGDASGLKITLTQPFNAPAHITAPPY
jgi:type IV pilus assembly protein PilE